jgi:carboxypeptidase Q
VPFTNYGETVQYRTTGPSRAVRHGAVAMLVRAVGPTGLRTPHTGSTTYAADAPSIPAAAIPAEDAERFQRLQNRGVRIRVTLTMDAHFEADAESVIVVGELTGRELPNEVVVMGGHRDALYPFIKVLPTFSTIQIMRPTSSPWLNLGIFTVE